MSELAYSDPVTTDDFAPKSAVAADIAHLVDTYGVNVRLHLPFDRLSIASHLDRAVGDVITRVRTTSDEEITEVLRALTERPSSTIATPPTQTPAKDEVGPLTLPLQHRLTGALYETERAPFPGFGDQVNATLADLETIVDTTPLANVPSTAVAAALTPRYLSTHVVDSSFVEVLLPPERRLALLAALGADPELGVQRDTINAPLALELLDRPEIIGRFADDVAAALTHHLALVNATPDALTTPEAQSDDVIAINKLYDRLAFAKGTATTPSSERYIDGVAPSSHVLLQADPDLWVARADADWLTTMSAQLDALDTQGLLSAETRHALARHRVATTPLAILVSDETRLASQGWPMIGALVEHIGTQRPLGDAGPGLNTDTIAKAALAIGRTIASAPFAADDDALRTMRSYLDTLTPASDRPWMFSSATIDRAVRTGLSRPERRELSAKVGQILARLSL
jgi:hypothetical protein